MAPDGTAAVKASGPYSPKIRRAFKTSQLPNSKVREIKYRVLMGYPVVGVAHVPINPVNVYHSQLALQNRMINLTF